MALRSVAIPLLESKSCKQFHGDASSCYAAYAIGAEGFALCDYKWSESKCKTSETYAHCSPAAPPSPPLPAPVLPPCEERQTRALVLAEPSGREKGCKAYHGDSETCNSAYVQLDFESKWYLCEYKHSSGKCKNGDLQDACPFPPSPPSAPTPPLAPICDPLPDRTNVLISPDKCKTYHGDAETCENSYVLNGDGFELCKYNYNKERCKQQDWQPACSGSLTNATSLG